MSSRFIRKGDCRRFCGTQCCSIHGYEGTPEFEQIKAEFEKPPFFGLNEKGECKKLVYRHGMPSCSVYDDRPDICKTFPLHPRDIAGIPECGFTFIKKPEPIVKPQPPNPFTQMDFKEQWPLFSIRKHVYPQTKEVYVEIDNVPHLPTMGHMRRMQEEVKRLEWKCWAGGITGWMIGTEPMNFSMQGAAVTIGAEYFAESDGFLWFSKRLDRAPKGKTIPLSELKTGIQTYMRTMRPVYAHH